MEAQRRIWILGGSVSRWTQWILVLGRWLFSSLWLVSLWRRHCKENLFRLPTDRQLSASQICGYLKDHTLISDNCSNWKYFICEKKAFGSCIWKIQLKATCYTSVRKRSESKCRRRLVWGLQRQTCFFIYTWQYSIMLWKFQLTLSIVPGENWFRATEDLTHWEQGRENHFPSVWKSKVTIHTAQTSSSLCRSFYSNPWFAFFFSEQFYLLYLQLTKDHRKSLLRAFLQISFQSWCIIRLHTERREMEF